MTPRPSIKDKEIRQIAAEQLTQELVKWGENGNPGEDVPAGEDWEEAVQRILDGCTWKNGYQLAKMLDDDFMVEPDLTLVELLDDCDSYLNDALSKAVREWVKTEGVKCPFKIGETVKFKHHGKEETGEIAKIYEDQARVTVHCAALGHVKSGMGCHGYVFNYEEVTPVNN